MAKQSRPDADLAAIPVLLTRPLGQSLRFSAALEARFGSSIHTVVSPLLRPAFPSFEISPRPYSALVFTSETAVEAVRLRGMAGLPKHAVCVGARTAAAAARAGFVARSADGDVEALLRLVVSEGWAGPLLYLHGRETRGDLARRLVSAGIETVSRIVYEQESQPLSAEATSLLLRPGSVIVPLFSPRSALLLAKALRPRLVATLAIAALSGAVAEQASFASPGDPRHFLMRIAARPDAEAMLDAIELLMNDLRGS